MTEEGYLIATSGNSGQVWQVYWGLRDTKGKESRVTPLPQGLLDSGAIDQNSRHLVIFQAAKVS